MKIYGIYTDWCDYETEEHLESIWDNREKAIDAAKNEDWYGHPQVYIKELRLNSYEMVNFDGEFIKIKGFKDDDK